jgi:hypothetical protein
MRVYMAPTKLPFSLLKCIHSAKKRQTYGRKVICKFELPTDRIYVENIN